MKQSKAVRWGMDISRAYHEIGKVDEPTFCNFNGVYLYGGCSAPPHEVADSENRRAQLAGMAMQALLSSPMWLNNLDKSIADPKLLYPTIATMAVQQADALMEELNKNKNNENNQIQR